MSGYIEAYVNQIASRIFIGIVVVACLIGAFVYHNLPRWKTERFVHKEVLRVKACDMEGNFVGLDGWGNPVKYGRVVAPKYVLYTVISAGRDGAFETADDIGGVAEDLNKSRLVGEWLGKKSKQAFIGVKEGWFAPSKFDEVNEK